jgi:aminoglycoside phosphotransferase (APT) family kinase protein
VLGPTLSKDKWSTAIGPFPLWQWRPICYDPSAMSGPYSSMTASGIEDMRPAFEAAGLAEPGKPLNCVALSGGVSSDIFLVRPTERAPFVVKRALSKLKVKDAWFADPGRNRAEQDWFAYVGSLAPTAVPRLFFRGPDWFAMEYLGDGFVTWKSELLSGRVDLRRAQAAGYLLGQIHHGSWRDSAARSIFATGRNFHELRIEPYLVTTGLRVPALRAHFEAEAERLRSTALALVHGDYSPKNLLVSDDRMVALDAEVAWFGDPAFDSAFLLTHLHLKAALDPAQRAAILGLVPVYWTAYRNTIGLHADADLERRVARLLLMIMLARVHGKSPVEYLSSDAQKTVTHFVARWLPALPASLADVTAAWSAELASV